MSIFVKCTEWKGESKVKGYTDCWEVHGFNFGVGRAVAAARGTSTRQGSVASVSEITVSKQSDAVSVKLFEEALKGKLDRKVEIHFLRTGEDEPKPYVILKLEGCGISGFSISSGGDRPTESVTLNFDKVEFGYDPIGDGLTGKYSGFTWDLAAAAKA